MRGSAGGQPDFDAKWSSLRVGAVLWLLCLAASSCGSKSPSTQSAPAPGSGPVWRTPAGKTPPVEAPVVAASPFEPSDPLFANGPPPAPAQPPTAAPTEEPAAPTAQAEAKPERDFGAELVQMMGSPIDCLAARAAAEAPHQLDIALTTQVMPSGSVAHSEVSASGLAASELACLRGRVEALHFAGPIENAPFPVHGSVHLERAATPAPALPSAEAQPNGDGTPRDAVATPSPTDTPL